MPAIRSLYTGRLACNGSAAWSTDGGACAGDTEVVDRYLVTCMYCNRGNADGTINGMGPGNTVHRHHYAGPSIRTTKRVEH